MIRKVTHIPIDLNGPTVNPRIDWVPVGRWASVELTAYGSTNATVELVRSLTTETPVLFSPTIELTAGSPSRYNLDTTGICYIGVRLKTAEGSPMLGKITIVTEQEQ